MQEREPRVNGRRPTKADTDPQPVLDAARAYVVAGISVIPIRADGSKAPSVKWTPYQERLPTDAELVKWLGAGRQGIAMVGGRVSGNLETIDFDEGALFTPWCEVVEQLAPGLTARLCICSTPRQPNGYHARYRCSGATIPGNTKLALAQGTDPTTGEPLADEKGSPKVKALIESRGEGGYALAPGTPGHCHPTGGTYEHIAGPPLTELSDITPEERDILWTAALSLNRWVDPREVRDGPRTRPPEGRLLPGQDFNRRGPDFLEIMQPHGWELAQQRGDVRYLRRPGKDGPGWSATVGYCKSQNGLDLLAIFSSNAHPFEVPAGKVCGCYSRFAVYTLLNHNADFKAAARELGRQGYGDQARVTWPRKPKGEGASAEGNDAFGIGPFTLRPHAPHRTPAGKITLGVRVEKGGELLDEISLSNSASGRRQAAAQIGRHLGGEAGLMEKVEGAVNALIVWAVRALDQPQEDERSGVLEIVRRKVPEILQLRYRTDAGGLWSETRRAELKRAEFLSYVPGWLLEEVSAAHPALQTEPLAWLSDVKAALEVVWAEQAERLPAAPDVDLGPDSAAAQRFRADLVKLWKVTRTWEVATDPKDPTSRTSLISRARTHFLKPQASINGNRRGRWQEILKSLDAWWRPHVAEDGEVRLLLAMRYELTYQVQVDLPEVYDQETLTTLGRRFGVIDPAPPVSTIRNGRQRLAVLGRELTQELLEDPSGWEEDHEVSMTPEGGCH